jgi:transposase
MIPSWRKHKAQERKAKRRYIAETYCPNCGHRFDRTGHQFACR